MTETCDQPRAPLDANGLRALAVLMAVHDAPADSDAIAAQLARLEAPGFDTGRTRVEATVRALMDDGALATAGGGWVATEAGRALAWELGGRAPGRACDATRTCLLLSLCLSGSMPEGNRRALVRALLGTGPAAGLD
jgi:hypothetical protein